MRTSVTWESVLFGLILRTVCSTNPKNHTVPAQTKFGTCGRSALQGWTVRTINQGLCREQPPLVRTADGPAKVGGLSGPRFSDSSDRFQTGKLAVICTTDRPASGRGPSACAQNVCCLHIMVGFERCAINRRGAHV